LSLAFADSPSGGGRAEPSDASERRSFLLHKTRTKKTTGHTTGAGDNHHLLEEVASEANLAKALLNVVRNKGAPGLDGQTVETAEAKAPSMIARLHHDLLKGTYRPGDVRRVWLPKPGGGQRGLGIPNIVDRLVQQAVLQILGPIFEPVFHDSSHGFRPKRGAHTAIAEASEYLKAGYQTIVDLDLANFFDRVHHQRLLARIASRVKDQRIITLINMMLKAAVVMPDGTRVAIQEGTPQGGPLSPLLSNIVLDELDRELSSIRQFLERRMRLQVNEAKSGVRTPDKVHFLGFSFRCSKEPGGDVTVQLSGKAEQRLRTKMREMTPPNWGRSITSCMADISRYLTGWMSHYRLCSPGAINTLGVIDAHIRRRIRAIIVSQRKRPRFLFRHLLGKGVSRKAAAGCAFCGKGRWVKSNRPGMTKAYPPAWFAGRIVSLKTAWNGLNHPPASAQLSLEF
jgi:retron-type reverse transcriptase